MKKYWYLFVCMLMSAGISIFFVTGCSQDKKDSHEVEITETAPAAQIVTIYYVDDQTGGITEKNVEIQDEYDIWNALKERGILTEDCQLLNLKVDVDEKKLDLDFNSETGDRIRSTGTTGETEIIGCIINTYLEAYECEEIRLTQEGMAFVTSHGADFDGYSGKMEF